MIELELQHAQDNLADLPAIQPLQIFKDDCTSEMMVRLLKGICGDTIRRTICIGRYALQHAMYVYSIISADETVEKALHVVSRLRKHRIRDISQSALYQLCRGRFFRNAKELEPPLELLEQHGYIWRGQSALPHDPCEFDCI